MKSLNLTNDHTLAKPQFCDSVWYATDNDQLYYFLKKSSYITVTYNVTKTGLNDILGNRTNGGKFDVSQVQSMSVDGGEEIEPSLSYNFTNTGTHTVRYKFNEGIVTLYKFLDKGNTINNNAIANSVDFSEFNGEDVLGLRTMFQTCPSLTSVGDLSKWGTRNVTAMNHMFYNCSSLNSVGNLSRWDTGNVTTMTCMFQNCSSLTSIGDLSNWNTTKVTNMNYMFFKCSSLTSIGDLSNWNTTKVTAMNTMFYNCTLFTSVGNLSNWNVSKVTDMIGMFSNCSSLTSVGDLSRWDINNVTTMYGMFQTCPSLTSVGDLSRWNTSKVTAMNHIFTKCSSLTSVGDLSNWNTGNVTVMNHIFYGCYSLSSMVDMSKWDMSKVTTINSAFICKNIPSWGDLSNWNLSKLTNIRWAFAESQKVEGYGDLSNWNVSGVTDVVGVFFKNTSLTQLNIEGWNLTKPDNVVVRYAHKLDLFWTGDAYKTEDGSEFDYIEGGEIMPNLTDFRFGSGYFNNTCEIVDFSCLPNWSHDSMYKSLYTNQTNPVTTAKTVYVHPDAFARLSAEEVANIATKNITVQSKS